MASKKSCLDVSTSTLDSRNDDEFDDFGRRIVPRFSKKCLKRMAKKSLKRLSEWLLEVEMGFVWGTAGLAIIMFVFAAIWFIDPALLTLVLRFRQARCTTKNQAFLVGISNCSWTSCRLGCTREIYKCWQIQVEFEFVDGTKAYEPPWSSVSIYDRGGLYKSDYSDPLRSPAANMARLYPNVRGCGYPPELNCEEFYETYKHNETEYDCWVSTMDSSVAITKLDLERAKGEVLFSLIPLLIFIIFVLYAFCRMGVFAVCNPMRMCPNSPDTQVDLPSITPKKLLNYKRGLVAKKNQALAAFQQASGSPGDRPPDPDSGGTGGIAIPATIVEEPNQEDLATSSAACSALSAVVDKTKVVTSAEVLPRKLSFAKNSGGKLDEDDLSRIEQELFRLDKSSNDPFNSSQVSQNTNASNRSETETVINELFGEEFEKMDRDRLADRYDVLDLKDLETYDPGSWIITSTTGSQHQNNKQNSTTMRRRSSKSPPADDSLSNSLWDYEVEEQNNEDNLNNSILSKTAQTPSSSSARAKHL